MTRKDYQAISSAIRVEVDAIHRGGDIRWLAGDKSTSDPLNHILSITERISDAMAADNPNFDRTRFLGACGL